MGWSCPTCGFELWSPVASLVVSEVGLYDDARFPGRCIVALREHHEHLDEVPDAIRRLFEDDVVRVGRALRAVVGPQRVNYAVLGNAVPHVHSHVIPRAADDPVIARPPWEHPAGKAPNPPEEAARLIEALRTRLV